MPKMRFTAFLLGLLFVAAVGAFDLTLTVRYRLHLVEQNPIGRWLIAADQGDVALLGGAKLFGTCLVFVILFALYREMERLALWMVWALCAFQGWLFWYLVS